MKTILIVDDEMLIALDIEATLLDVGYHVTIASDFNSAQQMIADRKFDAVVLDYDLRGKSTAELARKLQAQQVPFIVCSGLALSDLPVDFHSAPYLEKPIHSEILLGMIELLYRAN